MMETSLFLAVGAGALAFVLLSYERIPTMLVLLGVGVVSAVAWEPTLMQEFAQLSFHNHPLTVKAVAIDHGLMNLVGTSAPAPVGR